MKTVVVTQRCFNPNRPKTPVSNREHVRYIATRTGVVRNEGMSHGLFGKAFGMQQAGDIGNLDEFKRSVRLISQNKTNVYRAVISLTENDALQKGFDKRENWQQLIENNLSVIAEKMRIKVENLDWCAAVHMDKGHPHVHLLYWDRKQGVRNCFIHPAQSNAIRLKLNKYVFADEFAQLYKEKQSARDTTAEYSMDALSDALAGAYRHGAGGIQAACAGAYGIRPRPLRRCASLQ